MFSDSDFVQAEVVERKVVLGDGEEHVLWFRQLPNTDWKRFYLWLASDDEEVRLAAEANLVAMGLCDANGEPALTADQARMLKMPVLARVMKALREVNGLEGDLGNA